MKLVGDVTVMSSSWRGGGVHGGSSVSFTSVSAAMCVVEAAMGVEEAASGVVEAAMGRVVCGVT